MKTLKIGMKNGTNISSVLHTVGGLHPRLGGPPRTVSHLTAALTANCEFSIMLLSQGLKGESIFSTLNNNLDRRIGLTDSGFALSLGWPLRRMLYDALQNNYGNSLLHDHGVWKPINHYVAAVARKHKIPLVIHPRGMLEPWALSHRGWKKRLALRLYQHQDLATAALFFATSEQEADSIRRLGLRQPIAIIPNGVITEQYFPKKIKSKHVQPGLRTALFLSRIHPKKGLLNLIEAWGQVRPVDWRLCIAGPDEGGHLKEVAQKIRRLGLQTIVDYRGEVEGGAKAALFEKADLFILPSFSENFGVVVAEALAYGLPVITTRGTPWEGLLQHGCGWWIEPTIDELTEALREAMRVSPAVLQLMGKKGHEYAREFDWTHIAKKTADVYRWVLGQGSMPKCVVRD